MAMSVDFGSCLQRSSLPRFVFGPSYNEWRIGAAREGITNVVNVVLYGAVTSGAEGTAGPGGRQGVGREAGVGQEVEGGGRRQGCGQEWEASRVWGRGEEWERR